MWSVGEDAERGKFSERALQANYKLIRESERFLITREARTTSGRCKGDWKLRSQSPLLHVLQLEAQQVQQQRNTIALKTANVRHPRR